jgi:hypothetical protein
MTDFEIPESGSEYLYGGRRVRVTQTVIRWEYVNPNERERGEQPYNCDAHYWPNTFKPAPVVPKPGHTYVSERYEFHVYEVITEANDVRTVFGRERQRSSDDPFNDWYPESYSLKRFQEVFKEVSGG